MGRARLGYCFGCSQANPYGLHLKVAVSEKGVAGTSLKVMKRHCGFDGILHGGITMTMMDECIAYAIESMDMVGLTIRMEVDYLNPGLIGHNVSAEARVESVEGRTVVATARVWDADTEKVLATSKGTFVTTDFDRFMMKQFGVLEPYTLEGIE